MFPSSNSQFSMNFDKWPIYKLERERERSALNEPSMDSTLGGLHCVISAPRSKPVEHLWRQREECGQREGGLSGG